MIFSVTLIHSCKKEKPALPAITTNEVTEISYSTAISGGNVTSEGGAPVISRGICWNISAYPTISDNIKTEAGTQGSFTSNLTLLSPNTLYYVRAYATNSIGTAYGNKLSFQTQDYGTLSDIGGNIYKTITIGTQVWMAENLKTTSYRNGDLIGTTSPATQDISAEIEPKYQWAYNGDESKVPAYGRLYTWYAIMDNRIVCPTSWHVPADTEWTTLVDYLISNGYSYPDRVEAIAKSLAAKSFWNTSPIESTVGYNQENNNSTGFTGLPGGHRSGIGTFGGIGIRGGWWTSTVMGPTEFDASYAWNRNLMYDANNVISYGTVKREGFAVRCLKD